MEKISVPLFQIFIGVAGDIVVGDANENKRFEDLKEQMGNIFSEGADVIVTKTYTNLTLQPEIDNLMQEGRHFLFIPHPRTLPAGIHYLRPRARMLVFLTYIVTSYL